MTTEPDFIRFVNERIISHIVEGSPRRELNRACDLYGVDLEQFKVDHSEEILFALLKQ